MQFVWWLAGVLATLAACKFLLRIFKRLTGKENIDKLINTASTKLTNAADNFVDHFQDRKAQKEIQKHVQQRTKDEENRPIVTIR